MQRHTARLLAVSFVPVLALALDQSVPAGSQDADTPQPLTQDLTVQATLVDENGNAWTSPLTLSVNYDQGATHVHRRAYVNPDPSTGAVSYTWDVSGLSAGEPIDVRAHIDFVNPGLSADPGRPYTSAGDALTGLTSTVLTASAPNALFANGSNLVVHPLSPRASIEPKDSGATNVELSFAHGASVLNFPEAPEGTSTLTVPANQITILFAADGFESWRVIGTTDSGRRIEDSLIQYGTRLEPVAIPVGAVELGLAPQVNAGEFVCFFPAESYKPHSPEGSRAVVYSRVLGEASVRRSPLVNVAHELDEGSYVAEFWDPASILALKPAAVADVKIVEGATQTLPF